MGGTIATTLSRNP